jgi:TetR/AcrR family transcriptional regulator, mexJK operon transcriptional repressor
MPLQRDDQEFESKRQQIIDGALDVFATKGFENATNKDIARASKIGSPALIYHYFQDKADLFREVIEQRTQLFHLLTHSDAIMELPPREALAQFGEAFVGILNNRAAVSIFRLMLGEATRRPAVAEMINKVGPGRLFPLLRRYFERQMQAGIMRRMDSGAAVRCFLGPLLGYMLMRDVFPQPDAKTLSPRTMVDTATEVFLQGALVQPTDTDSTT